MTQKIGLMTNAVNESRNGDRILSSLKEAQRQGKIKGVLGRLGDLGTIDKQYDIAVSTACSNLDNILVESVSSGQQCMAFLRENKIGRGNFMCLDTVTNKFQSELEKPFEAPKNTQRLFDLIAVLEPRFRAAFYFGLRNTIVCKDLNTAHAIAFNQQIRHRVVTFEGALIESSGTLSGGGKPKSGGMQASKVEEFTQQQVQDLQAELDALRQQIQE